MEGTRPHSHKRAEIEARITKRNQEYGMLRTRLRTLTKWSFVSRKTKERTHKIEIRAILSSRF